MSKKITGSKSAIYKKIPSCLAVLTSLSLIYFLWHPSANPNIFIFSYFRLIAIILCLSSAFYFLLSLNFKVLLGINNLIFYSIVFGLALSELFLRLNPAIIPDNQLSLLPFEAGQQLANKRGLFTPSNVVGKGTMFHMRPGVQLPGKPWITIDKNGFYNNVSLGKSVDVVLLGASVLDARAAKINIADMFYASGSSAYSLAQGGPYGPFQFHEAYKKIIINENIFHRYVVILIILPNEFNKIHQYKRVTASGGDYRDLFQVSLTPDIIPSSVSPWTLSIIMKLSTRFPNLVSKFRHAAKQEYAKVKFRDRALKIPVSELFVPEATERWQDLGEALGRIFKDANSRGAKPLVVYYPLTPVLSAPFLEDHKEAKEKLTEYYENTVAQLEASVRNLGGEFLDVTPKIRKAQFEQDLMVAPGEYHLNQSGVKVLFSVIHKKLTEMGLKLN